MLFAKLPLPVADLLLPAVPLNGGRILLSILLPVPGVADAPFSRTVAAPFAVFGIGGDLFFVIVGVPLLLAPGFAADDLAGLKLRGLENLLIIAATPFTRITGVVGGENRRKSGFASVKINGGL